MKVLKVDFNYTKLNIQFQFFEHINYQVDVFFDKEGQRAKWCKIDIEIDDILAYLAEHHPEIEQFDTTVWLSKLPFKPEDAFSAVTDDEEQKEAIKAFWERFAHHV